MAALRDAEVRQDIAAAPVSQDVRRLDVQVQHRRPVRRPQRGQQVAHELPGLALTKIRMAVQVAVKARVRVVRHRDEAQIPL